MTTRKEKNYKYSFNFVEKKWRNLEQDKKIKFKKHQKSIYMLEMFPYPSGEIHVGHVRNYGIAEILRRYYYLKGYDCFRPMGWDAFGLPAENAALEHNINPKHWTEYNIQNMKKTLNKINFWYDWDYEISTCDFDYYKWQQKMFNDLRKKGLIYKKDEFVNWDPVDQTVLANEQVDENGLSWRSGAKVQKIKKSQWFLKITSKADELLKGLDDLKGTWPDKVISMQKNWIGKKEGYLMEFIINNKPVEIFTTTPEVVYGCNFLVLSCESEEASKINPKLCEEYLNTPEKHRKDTLIGTAFNTYTQQEIPVYIADYVINGYGTGVVMGVAGYDKRDKVFAQKNNIEFINLLDEDNKMINSKDLNGLTLMEAREKIGKTLKKKTCYRLKDWCLSRQRYWGTLIPVVYCNKCGIESSVDSTSELPYVDYQNFNGKGNPLSSLEEWKKTICPNCNGPATRETDTMDTFVDSSWYFLRFPNAKNSKEAIGKDTKPVDLYLGGIEHAILHLLYARFMTMVCKDLGLINFTEPFKKLITQGMVCHKTYQDKQGKYYEPINIRKENGKCYFVNYDEIEKSNVFLENNSIECIQESLPDCIKEVQEGPSIKMSKSKKNVINPRDIIDKYGTDALKLFIISDSPVFKDFDWQSDALTGCYKFLQNAWRISMDIFYNSHKKESMDQGFRNQIENHIFFINKYLDEMALNNFAAQIRKMFEIIKNNKDKISREDLLWSLKHFLRSLWIVSPLVSYEIYEVIFKEKLPEVESWHSGTTKNHLDGFNLVVQFNGKKKECVFMKSTEEKEIVDIIKEKLNIKNYKKYIYIKNTVLNFVNPEV